MTKAKISEYDAVASNNTDVNGVNIAENCPPSGMNNMGREIMAALKRFQTGSDGDGVTVGGNLVVSGSSTLATTAISSADINGGTIDGTAIGGASAAAGAFTTLNTSGAVVFNDAGADVDFRVEGDTEANLLFVDAGNDRVGVKTATPAVALDVVGQVRASTGILFGSDTAAANALDDYEEGTWSPVVSDGTNNGTMDGAQTGGKYTRIGNAVIISCNIYMTSKGSLSGSLRITGLPFTVGGILSRTSGVIGYVDNANITAGTAIGFYTQQNTTFINLTNTDVTGGISNLQASEINANFYAIFGFTYLV
jgi:hypothetical protein